MALAEELSSETNPTQASAVDDIDEAVGLIIDTIATLSLGDAVARSARYQSWFIALEAELFAANKASGATDRDNEKLAGRGSKTSKAEAKKKRE